mmetsp:Transcript_14013/g.29027  ORF Transcript_14013/g.29027 Transcript_14013/m.29027 type:complete len:229 (-) Transcript_14013:20-706(-)
MAFGSKCKVVNYSKWHAIHGQSSPHHGTAAEKWTQNGIGRLPNFSQCTTVGVVGIKKRRTRTPLVDRFHQLLVKVVTSSHGSFQNGKGMSPCIIQCAFQTGCERHTSIGTFILGLDQGLIKVVCHLPRYRLVPLAVPNANGGKQGLLWRLLWTLIVSSMIRFHRFHQSLQERKGIEIIVPMVMVGSIPCCCSTTGVEGCAGRRYHAIQESTTESMSRKGGSHGLKMVG